MLGVGKEAKCASKHVGKQLGTTASTNRVKEREYGDALKAWDAAACQRHTGFWPVRAAAALFAEATDWPSVLELSSALAPQMAMRLQLQAPLSAAQRRQLQGQLKDAGSLYEGQVVLQGQVPTRARSWHDFFNALVWASFPQAKRVLSQRLFAAIKRWLPQPVLRLPGVRSREQDTLAMLDEGGLLVLCSAAAAAAAQAAIGGGSAAQLAVLLQQDEACTLIFGHALYEHLVVSRAAAEHARHTGQPAPAELIVRAGAVLLVAAGELPRGQVERRQLADALLAEKLSDLTTFCLPAPWPALPLVDEVLTEPRLD